MGLLCSSVMHGGMRVDIRECTQQREWRGRWIVCCSLPSGEELENDVPIDAPGQELAGFQVGVRRHQKQKHHGGCQRGLVSHPRP
jgi:hypothetical protein